MTDDKFGKTCPVCHKRITPAFLARHLGIKHPTFDARVTPRVNDPQPSYDFIKRRK